MKSTQLLLESLLSHKVTVNTASTEQKNHALACMADELVHHMLTILEANQLDMTNAKEHLSEAMQDRLLLTEERVSEMALGIRALISLPDPVGRVLEERQLENGLRIQKKAVPFGLIGMIYESRPNVTSDAVALAIKSGNAILLRGGKEAYHSSKAILSALKKGLAQSAISPQVIELVEDTSRVSAIEMMTAKGQIDVLIPRGSAGLIQAVVEQATVPVIETGTGICHLYVDKDADLDTALQVVLNAKTSRPSVCNSAEVLLVHNEIAEVFLPRLESYLNQKVELRAAASAFPFLKTAKLATETDFDTEFLDYILAIQLVADVTEAIEHIAQHSTGHSEAILTENPKAADLFVQQVDSAAVYVNASTRFTDGGQFGLGCELGISTQKMHARGPMGLAEMTTYKYVIYGTGQIRE